MLVVPFSLYFLVQQQTWLAEEYGQLKADAIAAVAAVFGVQMTIFVIVIWKYWEDFMLVVQGKGHIPYEEQYKEDAKYLQSDQYQYDLQKEKQMKMKRQHTINVAKKKTEEQERSLFVGYFDEGSKLDFEKMTVDASVQQYEESKNITPWKPMTKEEKLQKKK